MPNFKTHSDLGVVAGYSSGALSLYFLDKSISLSGIIFLSTYAGSIFPDIDSDNSRTINIVFNILSVLGGFMAIILMLDSKLKYAFLVPPSVYIFIKFIFSKIFKYYSRHRGIYHSIPMAALLSLLIFHFSSLKFGEIFGFAIGVSFLFGYLLHLILDEMFSLYDYDQKKFAIKRSLGTAFSLKGMNKYTTSFVYISVFALIYINFNKLSKAVFFFKDFF